MTHRKEQNNQRSSLQASPDLQTSPGLQPPAENHHHGSEQFEPRKRMRPSFDSGRPVSEIHGMMPSPAVVEIQPSQYGPTASFSPMQDGHDNSYSLTALSMAAEYQALQGNIPIETALHHSMPTPATLGSTTVAATTDTSGAVIRTNSPLHNHGPTFEESLESLTSFFENEPLNSYHFASLISAEQPM